MTDPGSEIQTARRWWLTPVVVGVLITAAVLLLGDFRPMVERFYSVF